MLVAHICLFRFRHPPLISSTSNATHLPTPFDCLNLPTERPSFKIFAPRHAQILVLLLAGNKMHFQIPLRPESLHALIFHGFGASLYQGYWPAGFLAKYGLHRRLPD
jgi:hypothetical protein